MPEIIIEDPSGTRVHIENIRNNPSSFGLSFTGYRLTGEPRRIRIPVYGASLFAHYVIERLDEILASEEFCNAVDPDNQNREFEQLIEVWGHPTMIGFESGTFYIGYENSVGIRKIFLGDPVQTLNELKTNLEAIIGIENT